MPERPERYVLCSVLGEEAAGLDEAPIPGALGERIVRHVSREGWRRWLVRQQMIINEEQLVSADPRTFELLLEPMQRFLFHADQHGTRPRGFTAQHATRDES
jgi:Fe-S cluster biosynthesis and repair protein YggX